MIDPMYHMEFISDEYDSGAKDRIVKDAKMARGNLFSDSTWYGEVEKKDDMISLIRSGIRDSILSLDVARSLNLPEKYYMQSSVYKCPQSGRYDISKG